MRAFSELVIVLQSLLLKTSTTGAFILVLTCIPYKNNAWVGTSCDNCQQFRSGSKGILNELPSFIQTALAAQEHGLVRSTCAILESYVMCGQRNGC